MDRMHAELAKAMSLPKLQTIWKEQAAELGGETPTQFAKRVRTEIEKWQKVVEAAGVKLD